MLPDEALVELSYEEVLVRSVLVVAEEPKEDNLEDGVGLGTALRGLPKPVTFDA